jgi:hypothetical protein
MDLKTVSNVINWGIAASVLNENFNEVREAIESGDRKRTLAKGLFKTLDDLRNACPAPMNGDWGYVGTSFPAYTYTWNGTSWVRSASPKQPDEIELYGYIQSEEISDPTTILY